MKKISTDDSEQSFWEDVSRLNKEPDNEPEFNNNGDELNDEGFVIPQISSISLEREREYLDITNFSKD